MLSEIYQTLKILFRVQKLWIFENYPIFPMFTQKVLHPRNRIVQLYSFEDFQEGCHFWPLLLKSLRPQKSPIADGLRISSTLCLNHDNLKTAHKFTSWLRYHLFKLAYLNWEIIILREGWSLTKYWFIEYWSNINVNLK